MDEIKRVYSLVMKFDKPGLKNYVKNKKIEQEELREVYRAVDSIYNA